MSQKSLELLVKRITRRLSTDLREPKLQKGGVSHSFRVGHASLITHFMDKGVYDLDRASASKAATMVVNSLNTKFKDTRTSSGAYNYYSAKSYGVLSKWKAGLATDPDFVNILGEGAPKFSTAFNIGHGSDTVLAAVEYRTLLAYKEWQKFAAKYQVAENALDAVFLQSAAGTKLDLDSVTIKTQASTTFTTAGNIKKAFVLYVDLQLAKDNKGTLAAAERKGNEQFKVALEKAVLAIANDENWGNTKASPSVLKYVDTSIDKALDGFDSKKTPSTSKASKKVSRKKAKKRLVVPTLASIKSKSMAAKSAAKKVATTQRLQDPRGRFTSLVNVTSMINALLHGQLKQNMKAPALVYRSGRLASSVKVTQMSFTREGQVTAFYEYMKRPYQTFERGYKQGNEFRDPRRLIDKSIREVAEMYIHNKFDLRTRRM